MPKLTDPVVIWQGKAFDVSHTAGVFHASSSAYRIVFGHWSRRVVGLPRMLHPAVRVERAEVDALGNVSWVPQDESHIAGPLAAALMDAHGLREDTQ